MINKKYLIEKRLENGYTNNSLCKETGISPSMLTCLEKGYRTPSVETIIKLCKALDLDANKLLNLV